MKKNKKLRLLKEITIKNPVAKFAHQFNKTVIFKDKTNYSRKAKHKSPEGFINHSLFRVINEAFFVSEKQVLLANIKKFI